MPLAHRLRRACLIGLCLLAGVGRAGAHEAASAVESGRLQAHPADLFKPQTVQADVYTLRYIL